MATIEYWIQIENRRWDASPANLDRMTGHSMLDAVGYTPTTETLSTMVPGSSPRNVKMFNPIRVAGAAVDALILRRYKPPQQPDGSDAWSVPDDRKLNPWDLNERDPGENGTRGTIPGPTLEMSVGDSMVVHFRNGDARTDWDVHARTHSLHPHGVVFEATSDGAFPLSPPDPAQPVNPGPAHDETALWSGIGVTGQFKQGDRVPPGGTFTYRWNTFGWPTTAGVWLYHDHSVNDMDNVELGAIGMIAVHNPSDSQDVDIRLPTPTDPTAPDPALLPGGSPNGSPLVRQPIIFPGPRIDITPAALGALGAGTGGGTAPEAPAPGGRERAEPAEPAEGMAGMPGMPGMPGAPGAGPDRPAGPGVPDRPETPVDDAATITPEPLDQARAVRLGDQVVELDPSLQTIDRFTLVKYRIPPSRLQIMQLYHTLTGVGFCINGRNFLGNTPTIVAGTATKMRFGLVGMGSMFHTFHLHGHRWILPGPHGTTPTTQQFSPMDTPVSQFEDTRTFGPANSFVFTIDGQSGSFMRAGSPGPDSALGEWHMHCHVLDHMMSGMMGSLLIVKGGELFVALPKGIPPGGTTVPPPPGSHTVHLTASAQFSPVNLVINAGDTVEWDWDNADFHTVSSTVPAAVFDSGVQSGGPPFPTFSHTFNAPGTFNYQCNVHGPSMHGTITVM